MCFNPSNPPTLTVNQTPSHPMEREKCKHLKDNCILLLVQLMVTLGRGEGSVQGNGASLKGLNIPSTGATSQIKLAHTPPLSAALKMSEDLITNLPVSHLFWPNFTTPLVPLVLQKARATWK